MAFVLYGNPMSPFVRKVEVALREKGLDHQFEDANPFTPTPADWFLEISPLKRIPVLRDTTIGEKGVPGTIPDSSACCLYLERRAPSPAIYPEDDYEFARALWYEEYADTELAGCVGLFLFRPILFPIAQGEKSDIEAAKKGWNEKLPPLFDYLEGELTGKEYLSGGAFSIADLSVTTQLINAGLVAGPPDKSRWPNLVAHTERVSKRPSFADNLEKCTQMVRAMLPEIPKLT